MKKTLIIIFILTTLGLLFYWWFFNQPYIIPKKPNCVPADAVWSGGYDGGEWIELVEIKKDIYHFRIYQDWSGKLKMDADFEFVGAKANLSYENWKDLICCYTYTADTLVMLSVVKTLNDEKVYFHLKSIYPAYDGDDWNIIREKYNID